MNRSRCAYLAATACLATLALALTAAPALAFVSINQQEAEWDTNKVLRQYPGWRYKQWGYVDCENGRINGDSWSCKVGWGARRRCRTGRLRITNKYRMSDGVIHFHWSGRIHHC
ncbi:MAG TPA: hypothetical protein VMH33_03145 [Solirubrobacterales bacterium]|nr:hypothetical protein [Solirubrobacterales bacterium]